MTRFAGSCVCLLFLAGVTGCGEYVIAPACPGLDHAMAAMEHWPEGGAGMDPESGVRQIVLAHGERCLRPLQHYAGRRSDPRDEPAGYQRFYAAYGLALIGGSNGIEALEKAYARTADSTVLYYLATARASRGSPEDVRELLAVLRHRSAGLSFGGTSTVQQAGFGLALLRAPEAGSLVDSLGTYGSDQTYVPNGWLAPVLRRGNCTRAATKPLAEWEIPEFLIGCGTTMQPKYAYQESLRWRVWRFAAGRWASAEVDTLHRAPPSIGFHVLPAADSSAFVVQVGVMNAPLDGGGYEYWIRRDGSRWRVVAVFPTWVS